MSHFDWGPVVDIRSLPTEQQLAILGWPVWEALLQSWQPSPGRLRVVSVDRSGGVVTLQWEPEK